MLSMYDPRSRYRDSHPRKGPSSSAVSRFFYPFLRASSGKTGVAALLEIPLLTGEASLLSEVLCRPRLPHFLELLLFAPGLLLDFSVLPPC